MANNKLGPRFLGNLYSSFLLIGGNGFPPNIMLFNIGIDIFFILVFKVKLLILIYSHKALNI